MPDAPAQPCPHQALIEAFARDELDEARQLEAQRILEQSEPCRQLFQKLTAGRYPRLPNYTIIGQVGKGGFGVVYKAIHHAKERTEALKVLFGKTAVRAAYMRAAPLRGAYMPPSPAATASPCRLPAEPPIPATALPTTRPARGP